MLRRRHSDGSPVESRQSVVEALRQVVILLLRTLKEFSNSNADATLRGKWDSYIGQFGRARSASDLSAHTSDLKRFLDAYIKQDQLGKAQQVASLQKLVTTIAAGLADLSGDTQEFTAQLHEQLGKLDETASTDTLDRLHEQISNEIMKVRHLVQAEQQRQETKTQHLHKRVQALERQLDTAKDELIIDPLTQVYNRRAFDQRIADDIEAYRESEGQFSLLLFDIDHFKRVNDEHGHLVGDRLLRALAAAAKGVFRADDFIARYGGEEFAVLLYNTGPMYCARAAERFRLAVATTEFQYQKGQRSHSLRLTVSIGVAPWRSDDTCESLVERADQALYLAKNSGRNRVKTDADLDERDVPS